MTKQQIQTNLIGRRVQLLHPAAKHHHEMAKRFGGDAEARIAEDMEKGNLPSWHGARGEVCTATRGKDGTPMYQVLLDDGSIVGEVWAWAIHVEKVSTGDDLGQ